MISLCTLFTSDTWHECNLYQVTKGDKVDKVFYLFTEKGDNFLCIIVNI